jgi:hypothetical protein
MARAAVRLLAIPLLLALVACGACAERGGRTDTPPGAPTAATPAPPPPTPTPTPVPPSLACASDDECTVSAYPRPVAGPADCYCPSCPEALAGAAAADHEADWQLHCGPAFTDRVRCAAPMCARPTRPTCRAGACSAPLGR